jgi:hypothetical protein
MPICICFTPYKNALFERRINCARELRQSRIDILKMDAQRAAAALHQDVEVTAGLRRLPTPKL